MLKLLLPIVLLVWGTRHLGQVYLSRKARSRNIVYRPSESRTKAYYFYAMYLLSLVNAAIQGAQASKLLLTWGLCLVLVGCLIAAQAMILIANSYTEELEIRVGFVHTKSGPFRILRHPMRFGLNLEIVGLAIISSNILGWMLAVTFALLSLMRSAEENRMIEDYLTYEESQRA